MQTAGPGGRARHKVETRMAHQRHRQANNKAPPQEQDRQLEPERLRNPLRITCGRTRCGKPQAPQEEAQKPHQKRLNNSLPHTEQEERKKTQLRRLRKNPTHTHRDHQRWGPAAKTHKASYRRIEISGG